MVEVEIRTPVFDEEMHEITYERIALVRAADGAVHVYGDESAVPNDPVVDLTGGRSLSRDDGEAWVRNLPYAYRSGDLVAVVLADDSPLELEGSEPLPEPTIPAPPTSVFDGETAVAAR